MKAVIVYLLVITGMIAIGAFAGGLLLMVTYNGFASAFGWPAVSYWAWARVGAFISWICVMTKGKIETN